MADKKVDMPVIRTDVLYDPDTYLWIRLEGDIATIGVSPLLEESSGTFVALQIDTEGETLERGAVFGKIEAEKHVGHLRMPLSGKIVAVNQEVLHNPRLLNTDPYGKGWLVQVQHTNMQEEFDHLVAGVDNIRQWFEGEWKKMQQKGWIAE